LTTGEALGLLLGLAVLLLAALTVRRRILQRRYPCFEASVRTSVKTMGRGWTLGLGCYDGDLLRWYRLLSFGTRARLVLDRRTLSITGSRCPTGPEARALLAGHVVLAVHDGDRSVELGIGDAVRTHLTAWIETAFREGSVTAAEWSADGSPPSAATSVSTGTPAPSVSTASATSGESTAAMTAIPPRAAAGAPPDLLAGFSSAHRPAATAGRGDLPLR